MSVAWADVKLGDIFEISSSKRVFQKEWQSAGVPFYRAREIVKLAENGTVKNDLFISEKLFEEYKGKFGVPEPGDLMVSAVGTLGACYIVQPQDRFYFKDASVLRFKAKRKIYSRFFYHAFKTRDLYTQINSSSGSTVKTLTISRAKNINIKIPPFEEQKRIATILDKADSIRRKRQEAIELADTFLRSVFLKMFGDPVTNPMGWEVKNIGAIADKVQYGTSSKANSAGLGLPILRMGNVTYDGWIDLRDLKHIELSIKDRDKFRLKHGDLLFNRTNSPDLVGKTAVWEKNMEALFAGYLVRVQLNRDLAQPFFISTAMNMESFKRKIFNMAKPSINMSNINATELKRIEIPIPPIEQQNRFMAVRSKVIANVENHQLSLKQSNNLFSSLQQRAFRGDL